MITALTKLLPIVTIVGGTAASSPNVKAQITKVMQITKVIATQQEVSDIAKLVYLDTVDGTQPKPENFSTYLKTNLRSTNGSQRNNSTDQWGSPYILVYDKGRRELIVASAGPDQNIGTSDDIRASYPLDHALTANN